MLLFAACDENINWFGEESSKESTSGSVLSLDLSDESNSKSKRILKNEDKNLSQRLLESSVTIYNLNDNGEVSSLGSGAFIEGKVIVTNYHVIKGASGLLVKLNGFDIQYTAVVKKVDPIHDIALIEIEESHASLVLNIQKGIPDIGDDIWVAGSPLGLEGTLSKGIVSSIRKNPPLDFDVIQISAPISPGSSGGPVVNSNGYLIGVSVAVLDDEKAQNLNFAIPAKYIYFLMHE